MDYATTTSQIKQITSWPFFSHTFIVFHHFEGLQQGMPGKNWVANFIQIQNKWIEIENPWKLTTYGCVAQNVREFASLGSASSFRLSEEDDGPSGFISHFKFNGTWHMTERERKRGKDGKTWTPEIVQVQLHAHTLVAIARQAAR